MIYGTFLQSPLHWYLISGGRKPPVSCFYCFSDLLDVNKSEEKYLISFSSGEALWAKEAREERPEAPKRGAHVPS